MNKSSLSVGLIIIGGAVGALAIFFGYIGSGFTTSTFIVITIVAAICCVIAGFMLAFSNLLDSVATEVTADIADDVEDLKNLRLTSTQIMIGMTLLSVLVFTYLIVRYNKLTVSWGPVPVLIPTALLVMAIGFGITRTDWFHNQRYRTPFWVYLIPLCGLILSTWLGIVKTEDIRHANMFDQTYADSGYTYYYTPRYYWFDSSTNVSGGSGDTDLDFDCDGEGCAYALLLILLIIVTVILVVGSAFIPHFWFLSGYLFLSILALITIQAIRVRKRQ